MNKKRFFLIPVIISIALIFNAIGCSAAGSYKISYVLSDSSLGVRNDMVSNPNPQFYSSDEELELKDPVCADLRFSFSRWEDENGNEVKTIRKNSEGAITLYAKWKKAKVKITYDFGSVDTAKAKITNPNPENIESGESLNLSEPSIESEGFKFGGWYLDKNFTKEIKSLDNVTENKTVYAKIDEVVYSVYYELNASDSGIDPIKITNYENKSFRKASEKYTPADPVLLDANYAFGGWYFDSDFTEKAESIDAYTCRNVTLYAKIYKILTYKPSWGDASVSGGVQASDARMILRYSARLETKISELGLKLSDVDNDGRITSKDARLVLRMSALLITESELKEKYGLKDIEIADGNVVFV